MLSINQTYNNKYALPAKQNMYTGTIPVQNDTVQFKGRVGHEIIKSGKKNLTLIQETAFFREPKTLNYAVEYAKNKFPSLNKKKTKINQTKSE